MTGILVHMLNTIIIQPPLVQLNTPYPSGAYLAAFFRRTYAERHISGTVHWLDASTELFHEIFCAAGLRRIFELSTQYALSLADTCETSGDDDSAFQLRRYVSQADTWCAWIDRIRAVVCGTGSAESPVSGREWVHEFVRSAYAPRGMRMERYLESLAREVSADDARILASLAFADLADYITAAFDPHFALIRYAESLAVSTARFDDVAAAVSAPVITEFYEPLLARILPECTGDTLFCISIPFPGTFAAALATASLLKKRCGAHAVISFGGGYVNTELRHIREPRLFEYCDFLSFDKGYGSYLALFDAVKPETLQTPVNPAADKHPLRTVLDGRQFYKIAYRAGDRIVMPPETAPAAYPAAERALVKTLVPDFSGIDFSRSPRLADSTNPMHRIWNDGAWLKAYMAYGCYWHRCAFCDTSLDYVSGYCCTDIHTLYTGLYAQAQKTGVYGIHFVDEACPPVAMQKFALENCAQQGNRLTYWGNIRFEKTFSRDLADLLAFGGLTAVSGGIEIATGSGLAAVNKGTDMEHIVAACCAFKEAGILVHSYMIFGFWNQTAQELIDSMETLRQLFEAGLLDSAFWHKFSLTLHSTVFREWKNGLHPDLKPLLPPKTQFAENDIGFAGSRKSGRYADALNSALACWMNGEKLHKPVASWFDFKMPAPAVPPDFVSDLVSRYEHNRDCLFRLPPEEGHRFVWLGGKPLVTVTPEGTQLCWAYRGNLLYAAVRPETAQASADMLYAMRPAVCSGADGVACAAVLGKTLFAELRGNGLCRLL